MTSPVRNALPKEEMLSLLEDPSRDFPFYNGVPVFVSNRQWLFVLSMVVFGFLLLALPIQWPGGTWGQFIPAVLMPGIPLAALAYVAPHAWISIFGKVSGRDIRLMFGFALLTIIVSMTIGGIVQALTEATSNSAMTQLGYLDLVGRILFFAKTIPQLFGEEVITILPFLALLQLFSRSFGFARKRALIAAWLISSLVFGLAHLPTYDWNLVQCVLIIGSARMLLTLPWILTKNIWVSTGAHIINDWLLFLTGLLGASLAGQI